MTTFSKNLYIGNNEIGRKLLGSPASPVLNIGTTSACFQDVGKMPVTIGVNYASKVKSYNIFIFFTSRPIAPVGSLGA